jgi:hypothetical protein
MIAPNDRSFSLGAAPANGRRADGNLVTRCVSFDREALADLRELAWASNLPVDALVREAVDRYRRQPGR